MPTKARDWREALREALLRTGVVRGSHGPHSKYPRQLHLAIFVEPYLDLILSGLKTIETRFSVTRRPPFEKVAKGDLVLLKRSGGPIVGICEVTKTTYIETQAIDAAAISRRYARRTCVEERVLLRSLTVSRFATFLSIDHVEEFDPVSCGKRDRRGWVIVDEFPQNGRGKK